MNYFSKLKLPLLSIAIVGLMATGCQKSENLKTDAPATETAATLKTDAVTLTQGFEVGATSPKTAYDVSPTGSSSGDNVTLSGNSWNLYDALIGNLAADKKAGSWSARIRNTGKITMLYNLTTGTSKVPLVIWCIGLKSSFSTEPPKLPLALPLLILSTWIQNPPLVWSVVPDVSVAE